MKLKPCPFCGSENIKLVKGVTPIAMLLCDSCGATVSFYQKEKKQQAVLAWNRRYKNILNSEIMNTQKEIKEIEKLKIMLDKANIPYEINDDIMVINPKYKICRVAYPSIQDIVCSAVQGYCTYGYEANLIEIQGLAQYEESDEVLGWLTAEDVFDRIYNHWLKKKCNQKQVE